jgi:hypothetical protein
LNPRKVFLRDGYTVTHKPLAFVPACEECLSRLIPFGEGSPGRTLEQCFAPYHHGRNHQGVGNRILNPLPADRIGERTGPIRRRKRLGGLPNYDYRTVA